MTPIKDVARGRWDYLLPAFGIGPEFLTGRHGPCPLCGEGKDRFRFDNKQGEGTWFCSQCGPGDGVSLVMKFCGLDFLEAVAQIKVKVEGAPPPKAAKPGRPADDQRASMNAIWNGAQPLRHGDVVCRYLESRGIRIHWQRDLRFHPGARYYAKPGDKTYTLAPAMLAKVRGLDGTPVNVHRTFLTEDGQKAPFEEVRKLMGGPMPHGSAIRLGDPVEHVLGVAEGIETAMSASMMWNIPVWALINAENMQTWSPPPGVTEVFVFGDNDETFTGQAAAYALAKRLTVANRIKSAVHIPLCVGTDWNDVLRAEGQVA